MKSSLNAQLETVTRGPFFVIGFAWCVLSVALCSVTYGFDHTLVPAKWLFVLCGLCMLDIFALAKAIWSAMSWMAAATGTSVRSAWGIQTFFWGAMKLACLGVLAFVLVSGGGAIPRIALLCGLATLIIVPLAGGLWWSSNELKKELSHA